MFLHDSIKGALFHRLPSLRWQGRNIPFACGHMHEPSHPASPWRESFRIRHTAPAPAARNRYCRPHSHIVRNIP